MGFFSWREAGAGRARARLSRRGHAPAWGTARGVDTADDMAAACIFVSASLTREDEVARCAMRARGARGRVERDPPGRR